MKLQPFCDQAEWFRRAGLALATFMPELTASQVAEIVTGELWDEACNVEPEEAAEIYSTKHSG